MSLCLPCRTGSATPNNPGFPFVNLVAGRFGDHDYRGDAVGKGHNPALRYPHRIADREALLYRLRACFVRSSGRRAAIGYVQTIPLRIRRPVRAGCCAIAGKHGLHGALSNGR